jgi:hypothetical protein
MGIGFYTTLGILETFGPRSVADAAKTVRKAASPSGIFKIAKSLASFDKKKLASSCNSPSFGQAGTHAATNHAQGRLKGLEANLRLALQQLSARFNVYLDNPGANTSHAWSKPDENGTQSRQVFENGKSWTEAFNPTTGHHTLATDFAHKNGLQQRDVFDCKSGQLWHESVNNGTGEHTSMTDWSRPDHNGVRTCMVYDHKTMQLNLHVFNPAGNTGQPQATDASKQAINNAYETLGLSTDATNEMAKKAYREMALKWHPDMNVKNPTEANEQMKKINIASDALATHKGWVF